MRKERGLSSPIDNKNKILITRSAKAWIDFLATNDKTSPTYSPRLNYGVATENKFVYDRIDRCKYKRYS
jgi:hypothetical protein